MSKASIDTDMKDYGLTYSDFNSCSRVSILNSFSVCKFRKNRNKDGMSKYNKLYDCISNLEDAYLLAQLAMSEKEPDELVFIFPGFNVSLENYKADYKRALCLAEAYKVDSTD